MSRRWRQYLESFEQLVVGLIVHVLEIRGAERLRIVLPQRRSEDPHTVARSGECGVESFSTNTQPSSHPVLLQHPVAVSNRVILLSSSHLRITIGIEQ